MTVKHDSKLGGRAATTGVIPGRYALSVGHPELPQPPGWRWQLLTDVARLESGHTPSRRHPEWWGGDVPWLGIKDAGEHHGRDIFETIQYTNQLGLQNSSARLLPAGTVCLSRTASIGYITRLAVPMATSQDFVNWVCGPSIDSRFLMYILLSEVESLSRFAHGSTHQTIYFPEVKAFCVLLPPLPEQLRIAAILGALDDKIELNRKMNRTLEEMAQAIFKSWFIDFDGHDDLVDSEIGPVPRGWEVSGLDQIANNVRNTTDPTQVDPQTPYVGLEHVPRRSVALELWGQAIDAASTKACFKAGDTLFGKLRPYFHKVVPVFFAGIASTDILVIRARNEQWRWFVFSHLYSDSMVAHATAASDGTRMPRTKWSDLCRYLVVLPPTAQANEYNELVSPIYSRIGLNIAESRTLTELRDTLLPKLISGELRVSDAEAVVSEAV